MKYDYFVKMTTAMHRRLGFSGPPHRTQAMLWMALKEMGKKGGLGADYTGPRPRYVKAWTQRKKERSAARAAKKAAKAAK